MGLLLGIAALAGVGLSDAYKSYKIRERYERQKAKYGPFNKDAYMIVRAIGGHQVNRAQLPKVTGMPSLQYTFDLIREKRLQGVPRAYERVVHDLAKEVCEKNGIPFTGVYVNTFHLPFDQRFD